MATIDAQIESPARRLRLHAGELVRVRGVEEVLRTLDADGAVDGLPFMPEMLAYCGRQFRVFKSAHKTCDTIEKTGIRRMRDTVHLEGLRCDGTAHGGCQAGCLLFWKEAWLERVEEWEAEPTETAATTPVSAREMLRPGTRANRPTADGQELFRCQATELLRATSPLSAWDPRPYLRDLWTGNVPLGEFIWVLAVALFNKLQGLRGGAGYPRFQPRLEKQTPSERLDLRPGEEVEVRSKEEIEKTVSAQSKNRGLWFGLEMVPYCGGRYPVERLVERIIDEKTGRMLHFRNDCVVLAGVTCRSWFSHKRLFCPRSITPYWREIWLRRTEKSPPK
jgi:hypothetical protein